MKTSISRLIVTVLMLMLFTISVGAQDHSGEHRHSEADHRRMRAEWHNQLLDLIGVGPGMFIGEVGAGNGDFAVAMAKRVGDSGHIYANEIDRKLVEKIDSLCTEEGVNNVTTILGGEADPRFDSAKLDLVIMVRVYHHLTKPSPMLGAIRDSLKPGGRLVIVEPNRLSFKENDRSHTSDPDKVQLMAEKSGFKFVKLETIKSQFVLILRATGPE